MGQVHLVHNRDIDMGILEIYHTILPIPTRSAHNRATLGSAYIYTLNKFFISSVYFVFLHLFYIYIIQVRHKSVNTPVRHMSVNKPSSHEQHVVRTWLAVYSGWG